MKLQPGTLLQGDRYRIIDVLGQGGFGITYLAEQVMAERKVCIKEFFPKEYYNRNEDSRSISLGSQGSAEIMELYKAKFIKEAKTIAKLDHPNIIHIFDVFAENNTAYYVMEYIDGESLSALVKSRGVLPESEAIGYIKQVAAALGSIHEQRIMHLDIKPANVMLRKEDGRAVLIDFGLSKQYDAEGNQTSSTPVGISAGYAPMEQYQQGGVREFSPETDIYSLGATLYYLVTGVVPPQAATIVDEGLPELPAHLSVNVRNAIERSMEVQRKRRPHSIKEFLALLEDNNPVVVPIPTPVPTPTSAPVSATANDKTSVAASAPVTDDRTVVSTPAPKAQPAPQPKKEWVPKYAVNNKKEDKQKKSKKGLWLGLFIFVVAAVASFILFGGSGSSKQNAPKADASIVDTSIVDASIVDTPDNGVNSDTTNLIEPTVDTKDVDAKVEQIQQSNEIWYTSTDESVVNPNSKNVFGATIISNTYEGDFGIITFDGDVTKIGTQAFYNCKKLKSVTLPNSVTEIGSMAFNSCSKLTCINIPDSVAKIGENAFAYSAITSITIPKSMTKINQKSLSHTSLASITIPDSVIEIENEAFYECKRLTSVTIPHSVTKIGESAFLGCSSLTSITIPNGVTKICDFAFIGCSGLKSITISNSVTEIGCMAFLGCSSLTSITIPNSVTTIRGQAFEDCSSLTSITIPNSVTEIKNRVFANCSRLTSVTIPNSITEISGGTFEGCSSLISITIPNSVTRIGNEAFLGCSSLTSITIPNSVKVIYAEAFCDCINIKEVYCRATTPPSFSSTALAQKKDNQFYTMGCTIYVPRISINAYKNAAGWKYYANQIVGYDF